MHADQTVVGSAAAAAGAAGYWHSVLEYQEVGYTFKGMSLPMYCKLYDHSKSDSEWTRPSF